MTSAADPATFESLAPQSARMLEGSHMMLRSIQGVFGAALLITAAALWMAPGSSYAQDTLLLKLFASVLCAIVGLACLQRFARPAAPKVEVDTIRHEVRLVRTRGKDRFVLDRCSFKDLSLVENSETRVQLWGKNNVLLAEVSASDRVSHRSLVTALRVAGKL